MTPSPVSPVVVTETEATVIVQPESRSSRPLKVRADEARSKIEEFIVKDPIRAIAIALVAGLAVGKGIHMLFGKRGKKKEPVERVIIRTPREFEEWPA